MVQLNTHKQRADYFQVVFQEEVNKISFGTKVSEGTDGAELVITKDTKGNTYEKHMLLYESITAKIDSVTLRDTDFGRNILIRFATEGDELPTIISLGAKSRYATDFLHKLPNIKAGDLLTLKPYRFTADKDKLRIGISIQGNDNQKITSGYTHFDEETKKFVNKEGFPEAKNNGKGFSKNDWVDYFTDVDRYLLAELKKNPLYKESTDWGDEEKNEVTAVEEDSPW